MLVVQAAGLGTFVLAYQPCSSCTPIDPSKAGVEISAEPQPRSASPPLYAVLSYEHGNQTPKGVIQVRTRPPSSPKNREGKSSWRGFRSS